MEGVEGGDFEERFDGLFVLVENGVMERCAAGVFRPGLGHVVVEILGYEFRVRHSLVPFREENRQKGVVWINCHMTEFDSFVVS